MPVRKSGSREEAGPNRASAEAMARYQRSAAGVAAATIGANKKQHQNGKHAWADREYLHVGPDCWFADAKK